MGLHVHSVINDRDRAEDLAMIDVLSPAARFQVGARFNRRGGPGAWEIVSIHLMGPPPGTFAVRLKEVGRRIPLKDGMELEPTGEPDSNSNAVTSTPNTAPKDKSRCCNSALPPPDAR